MVRFEYKAVPAPVRGTKAKGVKTTEDRFALAITEALNEHATDGWEFVRVETLPCESRKGLTGTQVTDQSIMVFRRIKQAAASTEPREAPLPPLTLAPEPTPSRVDPPISRIPDSAEPTS
ncbi:MAG: DUF4177 domain-containing protein [Boseongicola sp.]|nr:DUF4177 domain-containing protein [Boseongicola sp.]